jgi:hypothetical protein
MKKMDERKKTIHELEDKKRENWASLNLMLEDLGEILLVRLNGMEGDLPGLAPPLQEDLIEYRRLLKEIADSEAYIKVIEADTSRLKELEEEIAQKEQQNSSRAKELSEYQIRLGKLVMADPAFNGFTEPSKRQAEELIPKISSLEKRLEELEDKNGANVFTWIGKSAQSMVIRSFLGKSQDNLRRIYEAAGEKMALSGDQEAAGGEALALIRKIEESKKLIQDIGANLGLLRGERRKIGDTFGAEGNPVKRIQGLEKHINHIKEELKGVFRRYGGRTADPSLKESFAPFLREEDLIPLGKAADLRNVIEGTENQIERLKASLAIDDEKTEIEKIKKAIEDHRRRIAASEAAILDLEDHIEESNRRIEELTLLMNG